MFEQLSVNQTSKVVVEGLPELPLMPGSSGGKQRDNALGPETVELEWLTLPIPGDRPRLHVNVEGRYFKTNGEPSTNRNWLSFWWDDPNFDVPDWLHAVVREFEPPRPSLNQTGADQKECGL